MPTPDTGMASSTPLITLRGITKRFGEVLANDHIDLDIFPGEIHALLGENGAGKSTLMKILYGFYRADEGGIFLQGEPARIQSPEDARKIQIGMVFQNLNLIPAMSVAENIALFLQDLPSIYHPQKVNEKIIQFSQSYGLEVNPGDMVSQLSIGEQQKVEIVKLLLSNARLLIFDEPTRVLAPHEVEALFQVLENLRKDGYSIVLITHKMRDVFRCANRISVLRGGRLVGSLSRENASEAQLLSLMFEKDISTELTQHRRGRQVGSQPVLELRNINTHGEGAASSLTGIDLTIFPGEIVGIAGVSGNGQKELGDVVLGMERIIAGQLVLFGRDFTNRSIGEIRSEGVSFIPENPMSMATVPFMTVLENMSLTRTSRYARLGGLGMDWQAVRQDLNIALSNFGFSFSPYSLARSLSGGNLQRFIIARELAHHPRLIIASYLTSGLDVQSAIAAREALYQARDGGAGVLLISEDLEELFSLCDRLLVLFSGKVAGQFTPADTDFVTIGRLMTGSKV